MPIKRSSYKDLRRSRRRHARNIPVKHELKTMAKNFEKLAAEKKTDEARKALHSLVSKLDKAASKGVIKENTASRKIARMMKAFAALAKT